MKQKHWLQICFILYMGIHHSYQLEDVPTLGGHKVFFVFKSTGFNQLVLENRKLIQVLIELILTIFRVLS